MRVSSLRIVTYRSHHFTKDRCFVRLASGHIPLVDLEELAELLDVLILQLAAPFLVVALVDLRLGLARESEKNNLIDFHDFGFFNLTFIFKLRSRTKLKLKTDFRITFVL